MKHLGQGSKDIDYQHHDTDSIVGWYVRCGYKPPYMLYVYQSYNLLISYYDTYLGRVSSTFESELSYSSLLLSRLSLWVEWRNRVIIEWLHTTMFTRCTLLFQVERFALSVFCLCFQTFDSGIQASMFSVVSKTRSAQEVSRLHRRCSH